MAPRGGKRAPPAAAEEQPRTEENSIAGDGRASNFGTTLDAASLDSHTEQASPSGPPGDTQHPDADLESSGDGKMTINTFYGASAVKYLRQWRRKNFTAEAP